MVFFSEYLFTVSLANTSLWYRESEGLGLEERGGGGGGVGGDGVGRGQG